MSKISDTDCQQDDLPELPPKGRGSGLPQRLTRSLLEAYLSDPSRKSELVVPLFDEVASRYDRFTRVFSFGRDRGWKEWIVERLVRLVPPGGVVLDLACGTADLALGLALRRHDVTVVALDASPRMLATARRRARAAGVANVVLLRGDAAALPFGPRTFHAVSGGYALRNAPSWKEALGSIAQILRPGGRLLTLDFYLPTSRIWARSFLAYLRVAGGLVGWLWHREPLVYGYIAHSLVRFTSAAQFAAELARQGLVVEERAMHHGGAIALHRARKS